MKWYCVTSSVDNRGYITAAITGSIESETRPKNTYEETRLRDIYKDWFPTRQEAEEFVEEARGA